MKKIILISLGVIILIIAGLSVYVSMIDWNRHKERLSAQISEVVGKKVEVSGNLSVSYSPRPKISAQNVKIINPQSGEVLAEIPQLETNVSLFSLLKGAPDIQSLYLVDAKFWIKIDENGTNNWLQQKSASDFVEDNAFLMQSINIENSQINFQDLEHNIKFDLSAVTAEIRAETASGPYRLDGNFVKNGENYGTALSVDSLSQLDDINVTFVVLHEGSESYVRYDGSYNVNTNAFNGFVKGDFQRTSDFINAISGKTLLQKEYNVPLQFSVDAFADNQKIDLTHFSIAFSQLLAGSGEILIPKSANENERQTITFKYQLRDLDVRPLVSQLKELIKQYQEGKKFELALPYDLNYDISAIRVIISDKPEGVLENVSIKGKAGANNFSIDDFYAGCAGNVVLNITGNLTAQDEMPVIAANIVADGRNFRNMINSLGFNLEAPTQSAYQSGKVTASLKMTPSSVQVEELQSTIDKSNIKMSAVVSLQDNAYDVQLNADKINLDNYIFAPAEDTPQDFKSIFKAELANLAKLDKTKVKVQANIDETVFRGVPMQKFVLDAKYADDNLTVSKLATDDILGTSADISADIGEIASNQGIKSLIFELKSQDLSPLIKKLHLQLPEWGLFSQKNTKINGSLNGDLDKINLSLNATANTNSLEYNGELQNSEKHLLADGSFVIKTTHLEQLLKDVGVNGTAYRGVLNGKAHIKGRKNNFALSDAEFKLGKAQYSGNIAVKKEKKIRTISGDIVINELNLADFIKVQKEKGAVALISAAVPVDAATDTFIARPKLSKEAFDFSSYRNLVLDLEVKAQKGIYHDYSADNLKFKLNNDQGIMTLSNISAQSGRTGISGNIKIEYMQQPKISGSLTWKDVKVDNLGGSIYALYSNGVDLTLDFDAAAQSLSSILPSLTGTAKFKTSTIKIKGIDLDLIKEDLQDRKYSKGLFQMVQDSLQTGVSMFDPIEREIAIKDGVIALSKFTLKNDHTDVVANGEINLKDWRLNLNFSVKYPHLPEVPAYGFEMTGALNKPIVDISVGDIARKYDEHWEKVSQDKEAEKAKIEKDMEERIAELKDKIEKVSTDIGNLDMVIDDYISQTQNEDTISSYNIRKRQLDDMRNKISIGRGKISEQNISNDILLDVEHRAQNWRREIDDITNEINIIRSGEINRTIEEIAEQANEEFAACNNGVEALKNKIHEDTAKLEKIGADDYLTDDDIQQKYGKIEHDVSVAADIHASLTARAEEIKAMADDKDKLAQIDELRGVLEQLKEQCELVTEQCETVSSDVDNIVKGREAVYEKKQRQEEKKRQEEAAEDANNLLVESDNKKQEEVKQPLLKPIDAKADAGASVDTGQHNILYTSEVQDAQSAPSEPAKPILIPADPSSQPRATSGKIIRSYEVGRPNIENRNTSSGILKPAEGIVLKPSGTITTK